MAKIEELLMEKSKLEDERDHAVDQLALFKKEVCMYTFACSAVCGGSAAVCACAYMGTLSCSRPHTTSLLLPDAGHH